MSSQQGNQLNRMGGKREKKKTLQNRSGGRQTAKENCTNKKGTEAKRGLWER